MSLRSGASLALMIFAAAFAIHFQPDHIPARDSLVFERNQGQAPPSVQYLARTPNSTLLFTANATVIRTRAGDVTMTFAGSNPNPAFDTRQPLRSHTNYILGNDPARWHSGVPNFARVIAHDVYPGIDVEYYGHDGRLEYDIIVAPGADPSRVRVHFDGTEQVRLASGQALIASSIRMLAPSIRAGKNNVAGEYVALANNEIGFRLGAYDRSQTLVIDPIFAYSTTIGGASTDFSRGIALDSSGNVYITGQTFSTDFPSIPMFANAFGGAGNIFVMKFDPTGAKLLYSTIIGGQNDDQPYGIAVDTTGNAYITGSTTSGNFPIVGGFQTQGTKFPGDTSTNITQEAFVLKLNPAGTSITYSSFLGGSGNDTGRAIGVDAAGNAYIAGITTSIDFPTFNAIQRIKGDANTFTNDAFVTKVNPSGSAVVYSTFLGGTSDDQALGIAVDGAGNAYVTGQTSSPNFPVVNAYQSTRGNTSTTADAFVTKINPGGTAIVYSTYLGGSSFDAANTIAIDAGGNAYVAGNTSSRDFPVVPAQQVVGTAFVAKLSATGSQLLYSKPIGGNGNDTITAIAVDASGNVYLGGSTSSTNFPVLNPVEKPSDLITPGTTSLNAVFVTKVDSTGTNILYSTLLGGGGEGITGIAVDSAGATYVTGSTNSFNFPMVNGLQMTIQGSTDAFLTKLVDGTQPAPQIFAKGIVNGASYDPATGISPGALIGIFGTNLAPATRFASTVPLPTSLFDATVTINGLTAPLFYVSATQINAQVPFAVPVGAATVKVTRGDGTSATQTIQVNAVSPGIFFGMQQGVQVGAILHSKDFSQVSPQNPIFPGEFLSIYCTGLGAVTPAIQEGTLPPAPPSTTVLTPTVTIGGLNAPVSYSGVAARLASVYQVNVVAPAVPTGNQPVVLTIGGVSSNTVITSTR